MSDVHVAVACGFLSSGLRRAVLRHRLLGGIGMVDSRQRRVERCACGRGRRFGRRPRRRETDGQVVTRESAERLLRGRLFAHDKPTRSRTYHVPREPCCQILRPRLRARLQDYKITRSPFPYTPANCQVKWYLSQRHDDIQRQESFYLCLGKCTWTRLLIGEKA